MDPSKIIDGTAIAKEIRGELAVRLADLKEKTGRVPGLATVIVGERKDSQTYVRLKRTAATEVGIHNIHVELPEDVTEEALLAEVARLSADPDCHGILVQLPLPRHISENNLIDALPIGKDVDGLHPLNMAALATRGKDPLFVACTPLGCMRLLEKIGAKVKGSRAVVLGRSNIVGRPMAQLLLRADATVTVCHSATPDIEDVVRTADILIAAVGRPGFVKKEWLKPGAIVIDVGTSPVTDATKKAGYRLAGDCDPDCAEVASRMTPVPGGVGPMTIAMLLSNTVDGFERTLAAEGLLNKDAVAPKAQ